MCAPRVVLDKLPVVIENKLPQFNLVTSSVTPEFKTPSTPPTHQYPIRSKAHIIPPDDGPIITAPPTPPYQTHMQSQQIIPPETVNFLAAQTSTPHFGYAVLHPVTGEPMNYQQIIKNPDTTKTWSRGMCQELE
eukprot:8076206-Ditylum_brightwellii.AAC.1